MTSYFKTACLNGFTSLTEKYASYELSEILRNLDLIIPSRSDWQITGVIIHASSIFSLYQNMGEKGRSSDV